VYLPNQGSLAEDIFATRTVLKDYTLNGQDEGYRVGLTASLTVGLIGWWLVIASRSSLYQVMSEITDSYLCLRFVMPSRLKTVRGKACKMVWVSK